MKKIAVADCETDPFKYGRIPKPFIWGFYDGAFYRHFYDTAQFVEFVKTQDAIIYAHNGGKFDWHFLIPYVDEFTRLMIINGRIAKLPFGKCELRDSYNILPVPLREFNKDDFDYSILEPELRDLPENKEKIERYLHNDCVYLYDAVSEFIERYGRNLTLAGAALKQWKKISGLTVEKSSKAFYDEIKPYYYGGRVECISPGIVKRPFKVIDINSAYPYAMQHLHPFGTEYTVTKSLPPSEPELLRSFITVSGISKGAFPLRTKTGLEFPRDNERRTYNVTGHEFRAALKTKTLFNWEIEKVISFDQCVRFADYVEHFYSMKEKAAKGSAEYVFAKLFLNSLYGKFGANPEKYQEYILTGPDIIEQAIEADGYEYAGELGKMALLSKPLEKEKQRYFNVAVAASITGFVRAYLWEAMNKCKGVLYCDTDSIICEDTGSLELHPTKLGAWDVEAESNYGAFAGKKLYAIKTKTGTKIASKGVRLTMQEICQIAKGETIIYKPETPTFSLKNGIGFVDRKVKMT